MKRINTLILPAALLALAGLSGCKGQQARHSGMPVIDRWTSPAPSMQPTPADPKMPRGPIEYNEPPKAIPPAPVPAPDPPSALLRPSDDTVSIPQLPQLPNLDDPSREPLHDTYFDEEAGHTPSSAR